MVTETAIVTLTRFPDIFATLHRSVERYEPSTRRIVVTSHGAHATLDAPGWEVVEGVDPFVFARNANLGLDVAGKDVDVVLINDDCELMTPLVTPLRGVLQLHQRCGLLSPQIWGGVGNSLQEYGARELPYYTVDDRLCFVCVYLPACTRRVVGPLDEQFTGYGGDDLDYSYRTLQAGFELGVTNRAWVRHGDARTPYSRSFRRTMDPVAQRDSMLEMNALFYRKHGLPEQ